MYEYSLRRGSRKEICPQCGKRTFKPYVDVDGNQLSAEVGRCDREYHCRYHLTPGQYYQSRGLTAPRLPGRIAPIHKREMIGYISVSDMMKSMTAYDRNPLVSYLRKLFEPYIGLEGILKTLVRMGVGTSRHFGGSTIYWLIDDRGRVRDGKIMGYDSETGCRIKRPYPQISTVHSVLPAKYNAEYRPCIFGAHQLRHAWSHELPICLFEGEKGALICSLAFEMIGIRLGVPMAIGGAATLNPTAAAFADPHHRMQALRGRDLILYPDEGKYEEWCEKAERLRPYCRSVYVSDIMERRPGGRKIECAINPGDGFDDLIIRYLESSLPLTNLF